MSEREQAARETSWFVEEVDEGVLLVRLDVPNRDVNVLSGSSLRELGGVVDDLETRAGRAVGIAPREACRGPRVLLRAGKSWLALTHLPCCAGSVNHLRNSPGDRCLAGVVRPIEMLAP